MNHDQKIDLLLATALTEEAQVVSAVLDRVATAVTVNGGSDVGRRVRLYDYPVEGGRVCRVATASAHHMGAVDMGVFAAPLLGRLRPRAATLIGIAAAVDASAVELGDVPFASQVLSYDDIAVESGVLTFRSEGFQVDPEMSAAVGELRTAIESYRPWQENCSTVIGEVVKVLNELRPTTMIPQKLARPPHLVVDVSAGGPFLLRDKDFRESLRKSPELPSHHGIKVAHPLHPKLVSAEMESHGFMRAAHTCHVPASVLKGISDVGDAEKAELEKQTGGFFRAYACTNAVLAALHIIRSRSITDLTMGRFDPPPGVPSISSHSAPADGTNKSSRYSRGSINPPIPKPNPSVEIVANVVQVVRSDWPLHVFCYWPGSRLVVSGGALEKNDVRDGQSKGLYDDIVRVGSPTGHDGQFSYHAASQSYIAIGGSTVTLVNEATKQETLVTCDQHASTHSVEWSPDGERFVAATTNYVCMWDNAGLRRVYHDHVYASGSAWSVAWQPMDNAAIAVGSTVRIVDREGKVVDVLDGLNEPVLCVCASSDGQLLAASGINGSILIWDQNRNPVMRNRGTPNPGRTYSAGHCLSFHPSGQYLAQAATVDGRSVLVWDLKSGRCVSIPIGGTVEGIAWCPQTVPILAVSVSRIGSLQPREMGSSGIIFCRVP